MIEFDITKNEATLGGQKVVFHCNHYNLNLQRTIIDAIGDRGVEIQIDAAIDSTMKMLENTDGDVKMMAMEYFSKLGFGILECADINETGGIARCPISHYALAWFEKFGPCKKPVCHFNAGYILGVFNTVHGKKLDHRNIIETKCRAMDPENVAACEFEVRLP